MQPVIDLLLATHAAGLGITHFTKGTAGRDPVDRITGSLAFGALPRVLFGAAKSLDEEGKRRFVRVASNIGPDGGGFEYDNLPGDIRERMRLGHARVFTMMGLFLVNDLTPVDVVWQQALRRDWRGEWWWGPCVPNWH